VLLNGDSGTGKEAGGNNSRAAARLGLTRTQLYVRLRQYQLL
jgi:DNA-binding NtrC family response regulator